MQRCKGISPIGEKCIVIDRETKKQRFSLTLLTSINPEDENHFFISMRKESNTAQDFLSCLKTFIEMGALSTGDILILDNATVHKAAEIEDELAQGTLIMFVLIFLTNFFSKVLVQNGIEIKYLPTYSPELNPCEKVFAQVKNWLRYNRNTKLALWLEVTKAFTLVTFGQMVSYYKKSSSLIDLEQVC